MRPSAHWRLRSRTLELGRRTLVMGVVNITPDSFSDGGLFLASEKAIDHALRLIEEGADIVDLGAESTRPGSHAGVADAAVTAAEEQARLLPVLKEILCARPDAVLSVDTYKAETARAALLAGAEIVNDVSGFTWDPAIAEICAEFHAGVVLSHALGRPEEWRAQPQLAPDPLLATVREGLAASLAAAERSGIPPDAIVLDPGYGFGKRFGENYVLLARQAELLSLGRPLLAGLSRKSFLGHTLGRIRNSREESERTEGAVFLRKTALEAVNSAGTNSESGVAPLFGGESAPTAARENASLAAMTAAILHGASIVRVHSVRAAVEAARIADAILEHSRLEKPLTTE